MCINSGRSLIGYPMDIGDRAAADLESERAEFIARQTAELLRDLDALERRIVRLEALLVLRASSEGGIPPGTRSGHRVQ